MAPSRRSPQLGCVAPAAAVAEAEAASEPRAASRQLRTFVPRTTIRQLLAAGEAGAAGDPVIGATVELRGWVRTARDQKQFCFVQVNDGSNLSGIQVVVEPGTPGFELVQGGSIATGAAVRVEGTLVASLGAKQAVEVKASQVELVGSCDAETYPLQKKRHTLEFLRGISHLRPRTNTIGAVARVRSALAYATHDFFTRSGFSYVHTPIISASDCEGAGEMFQVTTLLNGGGGDAAPAPAAAAPSPSPSPPEDASALQSEVARQGEAVRALKAAGADKERVEREVQQLLALKQRLSAAEAGGPSRAGAGHTPGSAGALDYSRDFFGEKAFLTVSGQLNAEAYACALGSVYTFGPTFRAENSNTSRHLAEFWMIEPEIAFADLEDDMALAEAYLRHCTNHILSTCAEDLTFFDSMVEKGLLKRLQDVADKRCATITYTEAVKLLQRADRSFEYPVEWGLDLQSEHERYLTEVVFNRTPLMVTDYPAAIKSFYMRLNPDGRTVAAMDMLVPKVGELIGGSQREERLDVLTQRMEACGLVPEDYWWYLDLRRYGSVPHAGFGLGFERLVQFSTGVDNIRDVIPFPRYPNSCKF